MLLLSACSTNEASSNETPKNESISVETPRNESSTAETQGSETPSDISDERKLETFISAFVEAGIEINVEEKPMFQLINATDGVVFYMDNSPVKIYEFNSETDMNKSLEEFNFSEWPTNGRFAIETSKEDAIKIFSDIK